MVSPCGAFWFLVLLFTYVLLSHEFTPATHEYCIKARETIQNATVITDADHPTVELRDGEVVNVLAENPKQVTRFFHLSNPMTNLFSELFASTEDALEVFDVDHLSIETFHCDGVSFVSDHSDEEVSLAGLQAGVFFMPISVENRVRSNWNTTNAFTVAAQTECERSYARKLLPVVKSPTASKATRKVSVSCEATAHPIITIEDEVAPANRVVSAVCTTNSAKTVIRMDGHSLHGSLELFGKVTAERSTNRPNQIVLEHWWTPEMSEYCTEGFSPVVAVVGFAHNPVLAYDEAAWTTETQQFLTVGTSMARTLMIAFVCAMFGVWLWAITVSIILGSIGALGSLFSPSSKSKQKTA